MPSSDRPASPVSEKRSAPSANPGTLDRAEILRKLALGADLSRTEAQAIVALRSAVVPVLKGVLEDANAHDDTVVAAAHIAGAIGAADLVGPLIRILTAEDAQDAPETQAASFALRCIGLPAVEALCTWIEAAPPANAMAAVEALAAIAMDHSETRERASRAFLQVLESETATPALRSVAASALMDIDWRASLPRIERACNRGRIDEELLSPVLIEEWRRGRMPPVLPLPADPLDLFVRPHQEALRRYRALLEQACSHAAPDLSDSFERDLEGLRGRTAGSGRRKVGRNDPCPCGSGRKFKKCHLEAEAATSSKSGLQARVVRAPWYPAGYALMPSEQLETLDARDVGAHLDLLEMPVGQLLKRAPALQGDYLRWAASTRLVELDDDGTFVDLATRVALSTQRHPALDYAAITRFALTACAHVDADLEAEERLFELAMREDDLPVAWQVAEMGLPAQYAWWFGRTVEGEWNVGLDRFRRLYEAHPEQPWRAVCLADAALDDPDETVLEVLDLALASIRKGTSQPHPALPDERCPAEVVRGYRSHFEWALEGRRRVAELQRKFDENALSPEMAERVDELRSERFDLDRRLRNDLEDLVAALDGDDLVRAQERRRAEDRPARTRLQQRCLETAEALLAEGTRRAVLTSRSVPGQVHAEQWQLLWVLPVEADAVTEETLKRLEAAATPGELQGGSEESSVLLSTALRAVAHLLADFPPEASSLAFGPWGRWMAIAVRLVTLPKGAGRVATVNDGGAVSGAAVTAEGAGVVAEVLEDAQGDNWIGSLRDRASAALTAAQAELEEGIPRLVHVDADHLFLEEMASTAQRKAFAERLGPSGA